MVDIYNTCTCSHAHICYHVHALKAKETDIITPGFPLYTHILSLQIYPRTRRCRCMMSLCSVNKYSSRLARPSISLVRDCNRGMSSPPLAWFSLIFTSCRFNATLPSSSQMSCKRSWKKRNRKIVH